MAIIKRTKMRWLGHVNKIRRTGHHQAYATTLAMVPVAASISLSIIEKLQKLMQSFIGFTIASVFGFV